MKKILLLVICLIIGSTLAYFGIGSYINKVFQGRIIDFILIILIMIAILVIIAFGLNIGDYFNINQK